MAKPTKKKAKSKVSVTKKTVKDIELKPGKAGGVKGGVGFANPVPRM